MSLRKIPIPAQLKGFLWLLFSGTAMVSAFILPIHFWAMMNGFALQNSWKAKIFLIILLFSALYHGLYRTFTILFDIGFLNKTNSVQSSRES